MKNLFLIIIVLLITSCGRNSSENESSSQQDQLPAATQTGANTAGCYINGKLLIPKDGINSSNGSIIKGLEGYLGDNFYTPTLGSDYFSFRIYNLKDKGKTYWIYVHINNIQNGVGEYTIDQGVADFLVQTGHPYIFARETNSGISSTTYLSSDNSGKIIITKLTNNICSGTFSGSLYNIDNPSEKIQVTDGRFDLKLN